MSARAIVQQRAVDGPIFEGSTVALKVKAYIPEGEAVQVQFDSASRMVKVPNNAPTWYRKLVEDNYREGDVFRSGYLSLTTANMSYTMGSEPREGFARSGDWVIRAESGRIIALHPEVFVEIYDRVPDAHGSNGE